MMKIGLVFAFRDCALAVSAAIVLSTMSGCSQPARVTVAGPSPYGQEGIHVSGTAIVRAKPDLAIIMVGCDSSATRASTARQMNGDAMQRIVESILKCGVDKQDIQTKEYSLNATYNKNRLIGCEASSMIEVKVRQVNTVSAVMDAATDAGANRIGNVRYEVESLQDLRSKARIEAAKVTRAKAEQLAGLMGVKLGKVIAITDGSYPTNNPYNWYGGNLNANVAQSVTSQNATTPDTDQVDDELSSGQVSVTVHEDAVFAVE